MASNLFSPFALRKLNLPNRIVVSPMCQYSAIEGNAGAWHLMHYGQLAVSGAALVIIEATAVNAAGRTTNNDLGLYSDDNEMALSRVIGACREFGNAAIGIQLAHSGRKGSAHVPWRGGGPLKAEEGAWQAFAPSAISRDDAWPTPQELTDAQLPALVEDYVSAAIRAARLGIDLVELHVAHGYLLHSFLSPVSNKRKGRYGGSLENRMRLPLEIAEAIRQAWPDEKPVGARITGSDWLPHGITVEDASVFARELKSLGIDYVCVSSGGIVPKTGLVTGPGYQVPFAAHVRQEAGIATQAVGQICTPEQADAIIREGKADMVALGRPFLDNPRWAWHAARHLGASASYPPQYLRCRSDVWACNEGKTA